MAYLWMSVSLILLATVLWLIRKIRQVPFAGRDEFLELARRRYKTIYLDGRKVRIQSLTEAEKGAVESFILSGGNIVADKLAKSRQFMLTLCVVDERGLPLFSMDDLDKLGNIDGREVGRVCDACARLSAMESHDLSELAEIAKNLNSINELADMTESRPTAKGILPARAGAAQMRKMFNGRN